jgi:hypothetical protein
MVIRAPIARAPSIAVTRSRRARVQLRRGGTFDLSREGLHAFPTQSNLCPGLECRVDCVDG